MNCYRHKNVETAVSCGRCDRPICPKCMISGPAGMRCPECASLRSTALYKIHPARLALTAMAALVVGVIGAYVISSISFFVFLVGPFYGGVVAEVVLRVSGRKRGPVLEAIGIGSIVLGYLLTLMPTLIMITGSPHAVTATPAAAPMMVGLGLSHTVWQLVGAALAISTCYGRLKYL
jgi:hypothetical protein